MMRQHLAILKREYLELILCGRKLLECRLTRIPCPPFNEIAAGEKVLLKESAGPVRAGAAVREVVFHENLTPDGVVRLKRQYNGEILGQEAYWLLRRDCKYCTLIWLKDVRPVVPYRIKRRGMQAWVIGREGDFADTATQD